MDTLVRCEWVPKNNPLYQKYHDEEWGTPVHDDRKHFEMLILESAQAGLSWETVLKKREGYRKAFKNFDVRAVADMTDEELWALTKNPDIIRNRLKIFAARKNAVAFLKIQEEFGSFDKYIWGFVGGKPVVNNVETINQIPAKSEISDKVSKDLKKRGMSFVGSTIIYAHLQATGLINDHIKSCFRFKQLT